jgi:hypothetical protein
MKTFLGSWFLLGLVGTLQAEAPQPELKIQVFVYNYAGVAPETLSRAEREAARIYGHARIETEWLDCPLTADQAAQYPACQLPESPTPLVLRVLSHSMSERLGLSQETFGSALLPEDGGFGTVAQICAPCAEDLAKGNTAMHAAILGHLMAHELGHLLLGAGRHGATGLMHVPWHKKALESVAQGTLVFTPWEGERMRQQVLARLREQVSAQASTK